jgi:type II secretory pathway component GspD/PulD (secretin)
MVKNQHVFLLCAITGCFLSHHSQAQSSDLTILRGEVSLQALVDISAERLGQSIEYDQATLRGSITLRLGQPLDDTELWNLTNRLLAARGYTTIRRPGEQTIGIVPLAEAAGLAEVEELDLSSLGPDGTVEHDISPGYRVVVVELEYAATEQTLTVLDTFRSPKGGSVQQVGSTNRIVLADLTPRVDQMLQVVGRLDQPDAMVTVERVALASVSAATITTQITQLLAKRQLAGAGRLPGEVLSGSSDRELMIIAPAGTIDSWKSLIHTLDRAELDETRTYRPRFFSLDEVRLLIDDTLAASRTRQDSANDWRIVENKLTGSLVITATPSQHAQIDALLTELAEAPPESRQPLRTYVINNRDVADIQRLVEDLLSGGMIYASENPLSTDSAALGGEPSLNRQSGDDRDLRLTIDEGTNTLLAAGEPRLLDQIAELITQLDVRRPQVMIEVLLVSLTEGETLDLGVELQSLVSDSGTLVGLGSLFGLSDLELFDGTADVGALPRLGGTAVILNPGEFSAVVRALETVNAGRSLSMPKVLVNDNESASIDSIVQEPFTSTNASDTVATTSFGGFESAGTSVSVTPQIAEGDHLSLQYTITLSSFTGESSDASTPPPRQQNSINSVATIPDGHTIAVGGIEIRNQGEAESQVPLLGELPLVGELFKNRSKSGSTSKFYAFIRSDIMRHDSFADLKHLSEPLRAEMEIDGDFPVLLPRVIR